jgi:tRNA threonylcarbamoyladenosine biosynthesis protein TsaB
MMLWLYSWSTEKMKESGLLNSCKDMKILAIETTGKYGSASVIDETGLVCSAASSEEMNHLKGMITLIDEALRKAGVTKDELTHVAASVGPGSFTGIRIGVTTARIMSQMLGIPCIAVSTLEAMAKGSLNKAIASEALYVVPVINARRHQTYAGVYEAVFTSDGEYQSAGPVMEEKQYMIEDLLSELQARMAEYSGAAAFFTGDGIDAYGGIIDEMLPAGSYLFAEEAVRYQNAESVAAIALEKARAGETVSYDDLLPEYMRLAEAEQRLKAGTLSDRIRTAKV